MKWALTIIRNGEQGDTEKISHAEFRFGRKTGELDDSTAMRLPSGLISALEEADLVDEALESGFFVEMCSGDSNEGLLSSGCVAPACPWRVGKLVR